MTSREGVRAEAGYIPAIEGLRGIAVLWVMFFHYVVVRDGHFDDPAIAAIAAVHPLNVIARNGYLGVDLFFLISGFLLTLPWFMRASRGAPPPAIRDFYARRFWRIAPAYYVQLLVLFGIVLPLLKGITYWRSDLYVIAANVIAHLGFVHNTTPLTSSSLNMNGALWTLAVEAQYYALVPLAALAFLRWPAVTLVAAFTAAVAWQLGARHGLHSLVAFERWLGTPWGWSEASIRQLLLTQLPSYLGHFAIGILAGRAWLAWREHPLPAYARRLLTVATVLALMLLYIVYGHLGPVAGDVTWLVVPLAFGLAFFTLAASDRPSPHPVLGRGPLAFLGRVSYSAYLYHLLVLVVWNAYMPPLGWLSMPLYLGVVIAIAWVSWRWVERPFLRRYRERYPTASAAAMARV
jgi:peptidoglycan/LPS O-acetylase OafA/YrhL